MLTKPLLQSSEAKTQEAVKAPETARTNQQASKQLSLKTWSAWKASSTRTLLSLKTCSAWKIRPANLRTSSTWKPAQPGETCLNLRNLSLKPTQPETWLSLKTYSTGNLVSALRNQRTGTTNSTWETQLNRNSSSTWETNSTGKPALIQNWRNWKPLRKLKTNSTGNPAQPEKPITKSLRRVKDLSLYTFQVWKSSIRSKLLHYSSRKSTIRIKEKSKFYQKGKTVS